MTVLKQTFLHVAYFHITFTNLMNAGFSSQDMGNYLSSICNFLLTLEHPTKTDNTQSNVMTTPACFLIDSDD